MDVTIGVTIAALIIIAAVVLGATLDRSGRPGSVLTVIRTPHDEGKSHPQPPDPKHEETTR